MSLYAVDSSCHIEDDSVVISRDDESDDESCILGSESSEDEEYSCANSRYKIQTICNQVFPNYYLHVCSHYLHIYVYM